MRWCLPQPRSMQPRKRRAADRVVQSTPKWAERAAMSPGQDGGVVARPGPRRMGMGPSPTRPPRESATRGTQAEDLVCCAAISAYHPCRMVGLFSDQMPSHTVLSRPCPPTGGSILAISLRWVVAKRSDFATQKRQDGSSLSDLEYPNLRIKSAGRIIRGADYSNPLSA